MTTLPASPEPVGPGRFRADVAIIGAGVAGLYAAVELPDGLDVVVVDKGTHGRSGSSPWAQGGMAVALGPDDRPDLHVADTLRAGAGLGDRAAAWVLATEAPDRTAHLLRLGARFDRLPERPNRADVADLHLAREGGQSVARSVHTADATGAEMVRVLRDVVRPRVRRLAGTAAALAREDDGPVAGVWIVTPDGEVVLLEARAVLLATGGCGGLYAATTNQDAATGDGVALAYLAGAAVRDLEFVQFHPTGLAVEGPWRFLLTEALRGAGATLHGDDGTRFLVGIHPDAELAPRHVVARAILAQPEGRAWLDATALGADLLEHEFPTVLHGARQYGFDLATERVPVTPAAHYMVGGVRTDLWTRASLPGLYAAGEVAATGLHGANRLAGNSLAEALVFGGRAAQAIAGELSDHAPAGPPPPHRDIALHLARDDLRMRLRTDMWRGAGPIRTGAGLARLAADLEALRATLGMDGDVPTATDPALVELRLAVTTADLIRASAVVRTESRGGHVRDDHPAADPAWGDVHLDRIRP
jgi:L-aspartate oxidase